MPESLAARRLSASRWLRADQAFRDNPHTLDNLMSPSSRAGLVPLTSLAALSESPDFSVRIADLRDPSSLDGIGDDYTHVFHFAALLAMPAAHALPKQSRRS